MGEIEQLEYEKEQWEILLDYLERALSEVKNYYVVSTIHDFIRTVEEEIDSVQNEIELIEEELEQELEEEEYEKEEW